MKLAYVQLEQHGASLDTSNPIQITVRAASGRPFTFKPAPDPAAFAFDLNDSAKIPVTSRVAQHALNTFISLDSAVMKMANNQTYSEYGRKEKLAPVREQAIKTLGAVNQDLREYAKGLQAHRAQFYAVPTPAVNDVVGFFRESEVRQYLRTLTVAEQMSYLQAANNPSILHAVLRSPIPNAPLEDYATRLWRETCEQADPVMAESFLIGQAALEWSTSVLQASAGLVSRQYAHTGHGSTSLLDMKPDELFAIAHPVGAADLFGFGPGEVARYSRVPATAA
jgi:hypothetical protein